MCEADQNVLGTAQQRDTPQPLAVKIKLGKGSVSSVSSARSPAISRGKDMDALRIAFQHEKEEERQVKVGRDKKAAKAGKNS